MDWLVSWKLDSYFELDVEQERWAAKQLKEMLIWHRDQELPNYTQNIHLLLQDLNVNPNKKNGFDQHINNIDQGFVRITNKLIPMTAGLAVRLRASQLSPFLSKQQALLDHKIKQWQRSSDIQRYTDMQKKLNKRLVTWIGDVNPEQKKLVAQWAKWRIDSFPLWLAFQKDVLFILQDNTLSTKKMPTQVELEIQFNQALFAENSNLNQYRQSFKSFFTPWLADLNQSLTSKQRERLTRRLGGLKSEFQLLIQ